jgi:hypothetical protein
MPRDAADSLDRDKNGVNAVYDWPTHECPTSCDRIHVQRVVVAGQLREGGLIVAGKPPPQ